MLVKESHKFIPCRKPVVAYIQTMLNPKNPSAIPEKARSPPVITTVRWVYCTHSELATGAGSAAKLEKEKYIRNINLINTAK